MQASRCRPAPRREQGWAGLVVLLLALLIAGFLARSVLKQMGMEAAGSPVDARHPTATARGDSRAVPTPAAAIERARGVEGELLRRAEETNAAIERAGK